MVFFIRAFRAYAQTFAGGVHGYRSLGWTITSMARQVFWPFPIQATPANNEKMKKKVART